MKKTTLTVLTLAMIVTSSSCEKMDCMPTKKKNKKNTDCGIIPAKIIRYDCDRVIFQLISNESIGDLNWEDKTTGIKYNNVVSYYNTCEINNLTNGELSTVYVNLQQTAQNPHTSDCVQCEALSDNVPNTKVDFSSVSKEPCGE